MGIDVGSTASKCIILKDGKEIVAKAVISVGTGTSGPARAMKEALEQVGLSSVSELQGAVATGYGRNSLAEVPAQMSELSCHAKGAYFLFPFLDVIAKVLEVNLEDLEKLDEKSTVDVAISSTCTVFAESEVISQLAKGTKIEDIVKGIHTAIASRVGSLAKRIGIKDDVVMTGGVALNKGMVRALERNLGFKLHTNEYCQLNGAIGAALFAYQKYTMTHQ